jgi:hypothetical protein
MNPNTTPPDGPTGAQSAPQRESDPSDVEATNGAQAGTEGPVVRCDCGPPPGDICVHDLAAPRPADLAAALAWISDQRARAEACAAASNHPDCQPIHDGIAAGLRIAEGYLRRVGGNLDESPLKVCCGGRAGHYTDCITLTATSAQLREQLIEAAQYALLPTMPREDLRAAAAASVAEAALTVHDRQLDDLRAELADVKANLRRYEKAEIERLTCRATQAQKQPASDTSGPEQAAPDQQEQQ